MDEQFAATLRKGSNKGAWTYLVWPESVQFFRTLGLVGPWDDRRPSLPEFLHGQGRRHPHAARQSRCAKSDRKGGRRHCLCPTGGAARRLT